MCGLVRQAGKGDKEFVLGYCEGTFSWGDYIDRVWDLWLSEGGLLVYDSGGPVGLCHATHSHGQVWIEGIRVHPKYRGKGVASILLRHAEARGREDGCSSAAMLIGSENGPSLSMASKLGYGKSGTWNYYSLPSGRMGSAAVQGGPDDISQLPHHVRAWRVLPITPQDADHLAKDGRIVCSGISQEGSIAIISDYNHFEDAIIATIYPRSDKGAAQLYPYLQDYGAKNGCARLQVLSTSNLPEYGLLERKLRFDLVTKQLR